MGVVGVAIATTFSRLLGTAVLAWFLFKKVVATENVELTNRYGVRQAPTLVVLGQEAGEYEKYKGVSEIKGMLTAKQVG